MRRLPSILLAACLIGLGCNSTGKKPPPPANPNGPNGGAFWSDDKQPNKAETKEPAAHDGDGMLAGRLIDSTGQPQPNALVNVTSAEAGPNAKPVGIQADDQGYFIIKGLNAGTTYFLSVRGEDHGRILGGSLLTQAPNTRLVIRMSEGNVSSVTPQPRNLPSTLPPPSSPPKTDGKTKLSDPPTSNIPQPEPVPAPGRDPLTGSDQSWGPGKTPPPSQPLPPPPAPASNPNIASEATASWPPAANIPNGMPRVEPPPPPPPAASPSMSAMPSNSSPLTGTTIQQPLAPQQTNFTVYDINGTPADFRRLSEKRLIVLDFWSSTCMPCLRKIPDLIDLQARYSSYLDVAGIACDNSQWSERTKAADGIREYYLRKAHKPINYGIWFEGEGQEGRVQTQFKIKTYPTMILLDHSGRELWRGSDVRQLEDSIKYYLMRK